MRRQSMCDAQKSFSAEKPWVPGHERTDAVSQRLQLQSQTNKKTPPHAQPFPQELSGGVLAGFGAPSFLGVPARGLFLPGTQEPPFPMVYNQPRAFAVARLRSDKRDRVVGRKKRRGVGLGLRVGGGALRGVPN